MSRRYKNFHNKSYFKRSRTSVTDTIISCWLIVAVLVGRFRLDFKLFYIICIGAILIVFVRLFFSFVAATKKKRRYLNSNIRAIDGMTGEEFELYLMCHFQKEGYKVVLTKTTNDYGADLVMKRGGETTIVQAKRYKDKVGNKAIQEIVAAKGYYKAAHCIVATNSFFTANARNLAASNGVDLWDRNRLISTFKIGKGN